MSSVIRLSPSDAERLGVEGIVEVPVKAGDPTPGFIWNGRRWFKDTWSKIEDEDVEFKIRFARPATPEELS